MNGKNEEISVSYFSVRRQGEAMAYAAEILDSTSGLCYNKADERMIGGESMLKLKRFDKKCVRILTRDKDVFEGVCEYFGYEYNEHEYGRAEDCLDILGILFFENDIDEVKVLRKNKGPYGRYSRPYGRVEELVVQGGVDLIEEAFELGEEEQILRVLRCLEHYLDQKGNFELSQDEELRALLRELSKSTESDSIRQKALQLLDIFAKRSP